MEKSRILPLSYYLRWPWWYLHGFRLRPDLVSWPPAHKAGKDIEFEVGFLGDLMGLGNKDLEIDSSLVNFFHGVESLVFNLEGLTDPKERATLMTQTTTHYRHLDHIRSLFGPTRLIAGVANNHIDDLDEATLTECLNNIQKIGFEYAGTKEHFSLSLRDGLDLTFLTFWKGRKKSAAATFEQLPSTKAQQLLFLHQGEEFQPEISVKERLRINNLPASVIGVVCHHNHFPQRIEDGERFIAGSLGNVAVKFGSHPVNWGIALRLGLKRNNGKWEIGSYQYTFIKNTPMKNKVCVRVQEF